MENPIKMDDLGVALFWKHPYRIPILCGQYNGAVVDCKLHYDRASIML